MYKEIMPESPIESSKPESKVKGVQLSPETRESWKRTAQEMKPVPKEEKKPRFLRKLFKREKTEKRPVQTQFKIPKSAEQLAAEKSEVTPAQEAVAIVTLLQAAKRARNENKVGLEDYAKLEAESDKRLIELIREYEIDQPSDKTVPDWFTATFETQRQIPSFSDKLFTIVDNLGLKAKDVFSFRPEGSRPSIWDEKEKHYFSPILQRWFTQFQTSPYYEETLEKAKQNLGMYPIFTGSWQETPKVQTPPRREWIANKPFKKTTSI